MDTASRSIGKKRKSGLKVYYTNCRSIFIKIDFLIEFTSVEELDIIAITEIWLDMSGKIFSPEVEIERYKLFHKDRIGRRGGVASYVKYTLQYCVLL